MKFLADEGIGLEIVSLLRQQGFDIAGVIERERRELAIPLSCFEQSPRRGFLLPQIRTSVFWFSRRVFFLKA